MSSYRVPEIKVNGDDFILIEAEKLSMNDEFMQYKPQTLRVRKTKMFIAKAINTGVKNFYRPKYDPSFDFLSNKLRFVQGKRPAVRKSYNWWKNMAKKYCPERNSRLGTNLQYCAFLGVLIKKLVEEGKSIEWAWNAVCNNSIELGHYYNSKNTALKEEFDSWFYIGKLHFESTGSREVCGFFDLGNTCKILAEEADSGDFWAVSGSSHNCSFVRPLSFMIQLSNRTGKLIYGLGWVVLEG